jgi:hypothetical protein
MDCAGAPYHETISPSPDAGVNNFCLGFLLGRSSAFQPQAYELGRPENAQLAVGIEAE